MTLSLSFTNIKTTTNIARKNTLTLSLLSKCLVPCVVVSAIVDLWVTTLSFCCYTNNENSRYHCCIK